MTIDLNVDLGEGGAFDGPLTALATSVNIACGGHAGDRASMEQAILHAHEYQAAIGAHPSFPDREHFGRQELQLPYDQVTHFVAQQIQSLAELTEIHHVKPHGALYNQAHRDPALAEALVRGITQVLPPTLIYTLPAGCLATAARAAGCQPITEGFLDRAYQQDGSLMPRTQPGAILHEPEEVVAQTLRLAQDGQTETLCIHGDSRHALSLLQEAHKALVQSGFHITAPKFA